MLEVGKIAKSHGLRGEVIVELYTNREERVAPGSQMMAGDRELVVQRAQPHQRRWIVKFVGVDSREQADILHGLTLTAEPIDDADALWVHELIDAEVRNIDETVIGTVAAVIANPAGDIIETDSGILIPLRFVTDHGDGFVVVDPPEGLLEL